MIEKRPRGRPKVGEDAKRIALNVRTDAALRSRIEASARAHGSTVTDEVERLLLVAFEVEHQQ